MVFKHLVRTPEQALAYLIDCTLATACDLASKKSAGKYETKRQISIAQAGLDWALAMKIDLTATRACDVVNDYEGSVEKWAEQFRPTAKGAR